LCLRTWVTLQNIGDEPLEMLEIFRSDKFRDFSLFQWLGETPQRIVIDTMFADDEENGEKFWRQVKDVQKDEVRRGGLESSMISISMFGCVYC
jgi:oxalate decarboxylase/phosphoglucose isomerase-like protein (cupin superfamily)